MKKLNQFPQLAIMSLSLLLLTITPFSSSIKPDEEKNEYALHYKTQNNKADDLIKQLTLSFVTPHLEKSLKQSVTVATGNSDDFLGFPATCFAPDTDQAVIDAFYENRIALANSLGVPDSRFNLGGRWSTTALSGGGLGQGDVTTLTWSYVPDGTTIGNGGCGVPDQGTFSSDFISFFNGIYGGPAVAGDFTTAPWHQVFVDMFDSWSNVSGLVFVYEPNDDGVTVVTGGSGVSGVRGDFRISGHQLDGNSGVLACNYFPNNGDMIIDTSDNFYSNNPGDGTTNVLTHEIGHGLGISHVCPVQQTKLMEPFVTTAFLGPQEDDVLAINRHYGDPDGVNDTSGTAVSLGNMANPITYNRTQRSIDDNSDVDYFSFEISEASVLSGTLTPTGTTYLSGVQNSNGSCSAGTNFNALTVADLQFEILDTDGTTILATGNANGAGVNESVSNVNLPSAGIYFVRVSQQGASINNVQMYDVSISLVAAVISPEISFVNTTSSATESDTTCFTDIDVPLMIGQGPSQDATVNFTINGSGSATTNLDFELLTSSVTFLANQTANQLMTLRLYHDGLVEADETIIIDFTVSTAGDATANTNADTFTLTLSSTDAAPVPTTNITIIDEDFETVPTGWSSADIDGDGVNWGIGTPPGPPAHLTSDVLLSQSWNGAALTPDNYILTNEVTIPSSLTSATLTYQVAPATLVNTWYEEYYTVYWATDISTIAAINASPQVKPGAIIVQAVVSENIDMTPYIGQTGYLVFRHHNCTDEEYIAIDDLLLVGAAATDVQTAINLGTADQLNINGTGTVYAYDLSTDNVMASLTNNQADDYGCSTVAVSRAGTGAQGYNGSTGANRVTDKTFTISTTNTIGAGDTSITFYFEDAEIAGWEGLTGLDRNVDLVIGRGNASSISETSTVTIGAFGTSNVTVTGNFTNLDGTFYFGPLSAFASGCTGGTKTWDGSSWSPPGAPDNTHDVVVNGDYNSDPAMNGNLEACTLTIGGGATLTVAANSYVRSQGDITVAGSLIVAHQGSVVQTDPLASVTKTGTINVEVTTPVLQTRDFMVMGSPMDAETRSGVFTNAFLVLDHDPNSFNPNTHPNIPQGATNFSDLEGDYWSIYSGAINVGEGYIVRPQSGYTDPANTTYDMTYELGTLNNGTVTRPMIYNNTNSPAGTPNTYANPYASAIDADMFIQDNGLNALYFWEHLTPPSYIVPGQGLKFDMDDVSIRNFGGGVAANNDNPANMPNGVISTGQGFAIKATTTGTVSFTNTMRLTSGNTTLRGSELEVDRLWLHLESNDYGLANNLLLGFNPLASDGWDNGYDTDRLASSVGLYSHLDIGTGSGDEQMAIQTRGAFDSNEKIEVGFSSLIEENTLYTISLTQFEGSNLSDRAIYLYDSKENILTDLTQGDYEFRSNKTTDNRRFTVLFEPDGTLDTGANTLENILLFPNPTSNILNITTPGTTIDTVRVIDVRGRLITEVAAAGVSTYQIDMSGLKSSMYFVEISTPEGKITKRIVKE